MNMQPVIDHYQIHGTCAEQTEIREKHITNCIWRFQYLLLSN